MSPTAWTPTVADEAVVRFLDRYYGTILCEDVGPLLGQAALLAGQRQADPSVHALVAQAVRMALADLPVSSLGAARAPEALSRSSGSDATEWMNDFRPAAGGRSSHRVTP